MNELLEEFKKEFEKEKKEIKLKTSLNELEEIFHINDFVLRENYVSPRITRQIARRIMEFFISWVQYVHGLIIPNPNSMLNLAEAQALSEEDKKKITKVMNKLMALTSRNSLINLGQNKKDDKNFIDDAVATWKEVQPDLDMAMKKIVTNWEEKAKAPIEKKKPEPDSMYG